MAGHAKVTSAQIQGRKAENSALRYLRRQGLRLVTRNYRCRLGEIDLIMHDTNCLVVVEVRYRNDNRYASAALSVDRHKQAKLLRTAAMFLSNNRKFANHNVRFDVIGFNQSQAGKCTVQWIRDAFRP